MLKKIIAVIIGLVVLRYALLYAFGFGALVAEYNPKLVQPYKTWADDMLWRFYERCENENTEQCGYKDTSDRQQVSCEAFTQPNPKHLVLFAFGQSNAANSGETLHTAKQQVINFNPHDGKCYHAQDPLLGPSGEGGSVWTRLGDKLLAAGAADQVLIVPFAIGGSKISRWTPDGDLHPRLIHAAEQLKQLGIRPTHVVWHQGEADSHKGTTPEQYQASFGELLQSVRGNGIDAPVYPAIATDCRTAGRQEIRDVQRALPDNYDGVIAGADTDTLGHFRYRFDSCHFSAEGLDAHAELWLGVLSQDTRAQQDSLPTPN